MSESSCECDVCNCITIINMNYICNDCLELIKKKAERRGRVEELEGLDRFIKSKITLCPELIDVIIEIEKRLLELEKGELK